MCNKVLTAVARGVLREASPRSTIQINEDEDEVITHGWFRVGMSTEETHADVFVYTGGGRASIPLDVVHVRVDPSVALIPARAFEGRKKLAEVELCEGGVLEIGEWSFRWCGHSITKISIPTSLRRICDDAFHYSLRCPIRLHDGIESIGEHAFAHCIFTNFRVPPLITEIPNFMLQGCRSMFSLEMPEIVSEVGGRVFYYCFCLRNVAFPPNTVFGNDIFITAEIQRDLTDLQRLFGNSNARITWELQHRFDRLPIHKLVYYQSYNENVLQKLIAAMNMRSGQIRTLRSKLDPTGNQQDCLGMTPLHILACSSVHDLELYHLIVEKYPTNLITEDRWGALPLLYAFWSAAPVEIIEFLLENHQSLYPDHVFNWTMMVETMGRCDTPKESIERLLCVKQIQYPEQPIDWEYLLDEFAVRSELCFQSLFTNRMQFLFMCGMSSRVKALAFKLWRDHITNMIHTADYKRSMGNSTILRLIRDKCAHFENELPKLKEAITILELALWKMRIHNQSLKENTTGDQKKIKTDESSIRRQCRVACRASFVIGHVLPFLISAEDDNW